MTTAQASAPAPQQRRAGPASDLLPLGDWIRHHSLRSWPVLLFLVLICVPSIALVVLGGNPGTSTFDHVAWIFAAYFAVAWLLLLGIPIAVVALIYRRRRTLTPRDYLFLGAVSGLVFGASEVVHYFTVNGVDEFYQTVQSAIPAIQQLVSSGHSASSSLFAVLIGPVRYFVLDFVWRFLTDPITHACWAGLTGYFIGLAATGRHRWYTVSWLGLAAAAILHGLNDWGEVNGHPLWILVTLISGILFLGYAKAGSRTDPAAAEPSPLAFGYHSPPARHAAETPARPRPWWEH